MKKGNYFLNFSYFRVYKRLLSFANSLESSILEKKFEKIKEILVPPSKDNDEVLMALYLQGEESAFEVVVARYSKILLAYLYRLLGNRETAEDVMQESFVRVYRYAWRFRPEKSSFKTWLYTIATNLARNEMRKKKKRLVRYLVDEIPPLSSGEKTPLGELICQEERERIQEAIEKLSKNHKIVFVLRLYEKLSYGEISQIVDCHINTARSRMFYAIEKVRQEIGS